MRMKHLKRIQLWVVLSLFLGGFLVAEVTECWHTHQFLELTYAIKIDSIQLRPGHRGVPFILVNGRWRILDNREVSLASYLQPGDSVVKREGRVMKVFRMIGNSWIVKDFESPQ